MFAAALRQPMHARADDWLAVLPSCALTDASLPSFAIVYPRPGLPALLAAGDTLVARVRVPAPLTPPPGIQQPRALVGWRAELIGHARAFAAPATLVEQRQPVDVVDVRPDSGQSLIYRASIPIPAWLAPGSYDLALAAPSGSGSVHASVRVLAPTERARLARFSGELPGTSLAIEALPVDVFVHEGAQAFESTELERAPFPVLEPSRFVGALRIADGLWVKSGCGSDARAFDDEVAGVLARERRARLERIASRLAFGAPSRPWPMGDALELAASDDRVRVRVAADFPGDAELRLLVPNDGRRFEDPSLLTALLPAAEPTAKLTALLAIVRAHAGEGAELARSKGEALHASLMLEPPSAASFGAVDCEVRGIEPSARVAWRFDADRNAFGPQRVVTHFGPLGKHRVSAFVLTPDGRSAFLERELLVETDLASGCHCAASHAPPQRFAGVALGCVALALLARRKKFRAARRRNRLRTELG